MKHKNYFIAILLISISLSTFSQSEKSRWVVGLGIASVYYNAEEDAEAIGSTYILQPARFNIAGYFFNNFVIDLGVATSIGDNQKYTNFDGSLRYNFLGSNNKGVPYIMAGGSFIGAKNITPTVNFGAGYTHWIFNNIGINGQLMYRLSEEDFTTQKSHIYSSFGIVYNFQSRKSSKRLFCE